MSKKDFIALADTIRAFGKWADNYDYDQFTDEQINALGNFCQQQNPAFNRPRWLDYIAGKCGPSGGSIK
jgi:hypothetical protein